MPSRLSLCLSKNPSGRTQPSTDDRPRRNRRDVSVLIGASRPH